MCKFFCCNIERIITKALAKDQLECYSLDRFFNSSLFYFLELDVAFVVVVDVVVVDVVVADVYIFDNIWRTFNEGNMA